MEHRPRSLFATCGGALLVLAGLLILWAAIRPAPTLDDLGVREGRIVTLERQTATSGANRKPLLRIELDDGLEPFFVHPKAPEFDAVEAALQSGDRVQAHVERHARQLLAGTPLARGRTEVWRLARLEAADSAREELIAYSGSAARRRRDRYGWGLAAGASLLVGAYGLARARRRKPTHPMPSRERING